MKILVLTTLFPNKAMPSHGVFVENRLRAFRKISGADVRVIAPVPWFPSRHEAFGSWAAWAKVPAQEEREGVLIDHPRYLLPPKIGMTYAASALERCFAKAIDGLDHSGWHCDLIDAHYFYPDGVAAVRIAQQISKPVVVTARGTDINLIPAYPRQKQMIIDAASRADACITVADALRDEMIALGAIPEKITTMRNGVDLELFKPVDPVQARSTLKLSDFVAAGPLLASVGHLIERKGHHRVIEALAQLPKARLIIVGDGPERARLEGLAQTLGIADRVRFLGRIAHDQLPVVYSAADILVLGSSREGWPNVLLEAMACGTPCVATPVWGCGEVIGTSQAGRLSADQSAESIAAAISQLHDAGIDRAQTRHYAQGFSWDETATRLHDLFSDLIKTDQRRKAMICKPAIITTPATRPMAIVTIDTEERFDWSEFENNNYTVCETTNLARFQDLNQSHGIKPIYFLTWPMIATGHTSAFFNQLATNKSAALGLHMHQWVNPPLEGLTTPYYSFQKNIPQDLLKNKFRILIDEFKQKFGYSPDLHRAGRYGIAPQDYPMLSALGLIYDFSPSVGFDFSSEGGPDFRTMSNAPFSILDRQDGQANPVHVVPVCGAHAIKYTRQFRGRHASCGFEKPATRPSLVSRQALELGAIAMRLSPEGATLEDMRALTRFLIREKTPILTFTLHSTTLTPSATDYTQTSDGVTRFLETCDQYFKLFKTEFDGEFISDETIRTLFEKQQKS